MPLHFITSSFLISILDDILYNWSFSTSIFILFVVSLSNSFHLTFWVVAYYSPYCVRYSLSNTILSTHKSLYVAVSAFNWKCLSPTTKMNSVSEPFTLAMVAIEINDKTPYDVSSYLVAFPWSLLVSSSNRWDTIHHFEQRSIASNIPWSCWDFVFVVFHSIIMLYSIFHSFI
jgi:hypothetical protein